MVLPLPLDEIDQDNFMKACMVMNESYLRLPYGLYRAIEQRAFVEVYLQVDPDGEPSNIVDFAIAFEEILMVHCGEYYDDIIQRVHEIVEGVP